VIVIKKKRHHVFKPKLKINYAIKSKKVRVVFPDGQTDVLDLSTAIEKAKEHNLDLIEVSPNAKPPVCKILDVGKYKYELEKKSKESRKHQANLSVKEMRMTPKIQEHDYQTKMNHIKRFLEQRHKVKVNIFFKGREITHQELGMILIEKVKEDLKELGQLQNEPKLVGRSISLLFDPLSSK